jgi:hypothetical protein
MFLISQKRLSMAMLLFIANTLAAFNIHNGYAQDRSAANRETNPLPLTFPATGHVSSNTQDLLIQIVTDRKIFVVTPSALVTRLSSIVELKPDQATDVVWRFKGFAPGDGLHWVLADFQSMADGKTRVWNLLQFEIALSSKTQDPHELYKSCVLKIDQRIRKASERAHTKEGYRTTWNVGKYKSIDLREGMFQNPNSSHSEHLVLIRVAVLQGEAES